MAMDMLSAIDHTSPSNYSSFEDYMKDYQMRWHHAFSLLQYAEEMDDESDDESVIGRDEGGSDEEYESDGESVSQGDTSDNESVNGRMEGGSDEEYESDGESVSQDDTSDDESVNGRMEGGSDDEYESEGETVDRVISYF